MPYKPYVKTGYLTHPQVRLFILARGRTRARTRHPLLVHTLVSADYDPAVTARLTEQQLKVYECAVHGMSVAEVSAHSKQALGFVRVILGDMANEGIISIHPATEYVDDNPVVTEDLLERIIGGLSRL